MKNPMRIIDAHTHPIMFRRGDSEEELAALVKHGSALGIERMVALGDVLLHGRNCTEAQVRAINNGTARVLRWQPDYFVGFCFLNPKLGARAVQAEVDRCVQRFGFKGIKLEICNNARSRVMDPVMKAAREWKIPILQHTWSQTIIRQRSFHTDPADTALLARRHPDVNIIMAHLSGFGVRGVLEARGLPNLYIDTSGGLPDDGLLEYAVEQLGADHILHGSDLPGRAPGISIQRVLGAYLKRGDQELILHGNAARLLNLD